MLKKSQIYPIVILIKTISFMNIFKIFPKSRQHLIESLEFSFFLYDIIISLAIKYRNIKNRSIKFFLKVVSWWRD